MLLSTFPILYLHLFLAELEVDYCVCVQAYHQIDQVVRQAVAAQPHLNSPGKADSRIYGLLLALTVPAVTKFVTERVLSIRTRNVDDGNQRSSGSFPRGHCGLSGGRRKGVLRGASRQLS